MTERQASEIANRIADELFTGREGLVDSLQLRKYGNSCAFGEFCRGDFIMMVIRHLLQDDPLPDENCRCGHPLSHHAAGVGCVDCQCGRDPAMRTP